MKVRMHVAFLVFALLAATSCSKETALPADLPKAENVQAIEGALLQLVNQHRASRGFPQLTFSQVAYSYANQHTDYMIASGTISHHDFTARATKISEAVDAKAVAENVAKDYPSAEAALQGWLQSPEHRETMEGTFTHTAVSVKKAPDGTLYYTQLFYLQ